MSVVRVGVERENKTHSYQESPTTNTLSQKSSKMADDEVAALVVDNGSGKRELQLFSPFFESKK